MPTIVERIAKISRDKKLSAEEKIGKLHDILYNTRIAKVQAARAIARIVPDTKQALEDLIDAYQQIHSYGVHNQEFYSKARAIKRQIANNILKIDSDNIDFQTAKTLVAFANSVDDPLYAVSMAKSLNDPYWINQLKTYKTDALQIIGLLKDIAIAEIENPTPDVTDNSTYINDSHSRHSLAIKAIVNIAKMQRHPELRGYAYEALGDIGTKRAAKGIVTLLEHHYTSKLPVIPEGKRGNPEPPKSLREEKTLDARGLAALEAIGEAAIEPLRRLGNVEEISFFHPPMTSPKNHPLFQVVNILLDMDTPSSLRMVSQLLLDNPEYKGNLSSGAFTRDEKRFIEDHVMGAFRASTSAKVASALVDFGAAERRGVSEAYSERANTALNSMIVLYRRAKALKVSAGEMVGIKMAAEELVAAITSDESLERRLIVGKRDQFTIGRVEHQLGKSDAEAFSDKERRRVSSHRTKKDVRRDVRALVKLFDTAKEIGLLGEDDQSAKRIKAYKEFVFARGSASTAASRKMAMPQ